MLLDCHIIKINKNLHIRKTSKILSVLHTRTLLFSHFKRESLFIFTQKSISFQYKNNKTFIFKNEYSEPIRLYHMPSECFVIPETELSSF